MMHTQMKTRKTVSGFTLIEMIVVIAIISVLAAMLVPSLIGYMERAYNSADAQTGKVLCEAIQSECALEPENMYKFTRNPWLGGSNSDGTSYRADDHGYIYVSHTEVRVSSYAIAKLLEENGYITSAGSMTEEIKEYKYPASQCDPRLLCRSNRTWYRYQINIAERDGFVYFTYTANSKNESKNVSGMSSGNNQHDDNATAEFARYIGGDPDPIVSLPKL